MGTAGTFTVTATGFPAPTFSETGSLPTGVSLNSTTGVLSGTPIIGSNGSYPITITAANGTLPDASQSFTLTVNAASAAPTITSGSSTTFTVGTAGTFTVTATGNPAPTFSETGSLPTGVSLNSTTGVLSGTPGAGTGGTYPITITAANGVLPNATQSFTLTVDQAPSITSGNATTFTVGTAGTFTVTSTGFPAATYSETGSLPTGLSLNPTTGVLSGTPGAGTGGTYPITITATNGTLPNASQSFTLTVNEAPSITSGSSTTFTVGTAGTFTVTSSGFPTATYSEIGTLPSGVSLNPTTGVLSGTPGAGTAGSYPITITAANGVLPNATQSFTLTVNASQNATTITCSAGGTLTFESPGLSAGGALSSATTVKSSLAITPTGSGCSGLAIKESIPTATALCQQTAGVPDPGDPAACLASKTSRSGTTYSIATKPYYYDTTAQYNATSLSDLQAALAVKPLKTTVDNVAVVLAYGTASQVAPGGVCGSDTGFDLTGNAQVKGLTVATYADTLCLSGDTGTGTTDIFSNDLASPTAVIATATIGGSSSLTITFPNENCSAGGTLTFESPGLSAGGALSSATTVKSSLAITPTGSGCSGLAIKESIPTATALCQQTAGVPDPGDPAACLASKTSRSGTTYSIATKPYYYDTTAQYNATSLSDLQAALAVKPLKTTVDNVAVVLAYGTASQVAPGGVCGSDTGFDLTGNAQVKGLTVATYADTLCLSGDTGTGTTDIFSNDLASPTAVIATATIGGSSSLTITFG